MKAKTIRKHLSWKINDWLKSIDDPAVQKMAKKDVIVTGGCIASMLLKEPINDYDVYFRTRETTIAVAKYYLDKFLKSNNHWTDEKISRFEVDTSRDDRVEIHIKSAGVAGEDTNATGYQYFEGRPDEEGGSFVERTVSVETISDVYEETQAEARKVESCEKDPYRPIFMSTNAITLSGKIQLVLRFYGEPDELHENYDYVHCTNYWEAATGNLTLNQKALEAILAKELVYVGSKYPICSIIRLRKFISRGWSINAGQIVKMAFQISELDLTDVDVLRDQLTGVDSAYFVQVINRLQEKDAKKIDGAYLIEIIDRIF